MRRIGMVAYTHYASDARPRRTAEALARRGDEVDFFDLEGGEATAEPPRGVRLVHLPVTRYRGASGGAYLRSYLRFFAAAAWRLGSGRYDVVYVHTMPDFLAFASLFAKVRGARVILDVHDTMPELYRSKFGVGRRHPLIRALAWQEQQSCAFADQVICVHEPHRALLARRGTPRGKITPILNVPDPAIFGVPRTPRRDLGPRLVYHGTIARRLGLDLALDAFRRLLPEIPAARFSIYGTGDDAGRIRALVSRWGLGGAVDFPDRQFRVDEIPALLEGAAIGVVPNRRDPATALMLPVKLLECVHLGIGVVAPRLDAITYHFGDEAVSYYPPGDVAGLTRQLRSLLVDPERRLAQSLAAQRIAERFAWAKMERRLFDAVDG